MDFEDREALEDLLSEQLAGEGARPARAHILVPQRGDKRALLDLAGNNAKQSYDQRFRVMKPNTKAIQEALQDVLGLAELPKRIECFDISHIQGAETVASMVVWEDGQMKKSDYRKFIIRDVVGVDDFASMREVVTRRYKRIQEEKRRKMPSLVLIDGGLGQLHAAAEALEALEIINQPLAAIAKREEIIYVYGQESEPVALDHHSPVLHLVQLIRDEAHRFAVTFHRKRRQMRDRSTELREIPGRGGKHNPAVAGSILAACRLSSRRIPRPFPRWSRAPRRKRFWITSGNRTRRCSGRNLNIYRRDNSSRLLGELGVLGGAIPFWILPARKKISLAYTA